jgi:rRNA maturation protein Rpf1
MGASNKIFVTTSRNSTPTMRTFCNDLRRMIPNTVRVNRGKMSLDEVAEKALEQEANRVIIIDGWRGGPGKIRFFKIGESGLFSISLIINIASIRLQREFCVSKIKPAFSLVLSCARALKELLMVADVFSNFFTIPILSMDAAAKTNTPVMRVGLAKDNKIEMTFMVEHQHVEVGPRIIVSNMELIER